jgi:hypothetical protein
MAEITAHSSLQEVAAIVSQALVAHGVEASRSEWGAAGFLRTHLRTPASCSWPPESRKQLALQGSVRLAVGIAIAAAE